jgi:hypothetical protein
MELLVVWMNCCVDSERERELLAMQCYENELPGDRNASTRRAEVTPGLEVEVVIIVVVVI